MELRSGTYLQGDKYRIERTLGRGGFGVTYLAVHELMDSMVCVKEFFPKGFYNRDADSCTLTLASPSNADAMEQYKQKFLKEAKTIAKLKHPNIIRITDVFQENNTAYYVMEYVEGESLAEIVSRDGAIKESRALKYTRSILSAADYIHERNIVHLDIKPGNIMLRKDDDTPILIDFGLSKQYDDGGMQTSSTPVGISHGFAPLEQYQAGGVSTFSPTSDIYSIGATLYYLVLGKIPPMAAQVGEDGIGELPKSLSQGTCKAIEQSMQYRRKDRPASAKAVLEILEDVQIVDVVVSEDTVIAQPVEDIEKTVIQNDINPQYRVGNYYNVNGKEGIIFEVTPDGRHGKIISLDETDLQWCTGEQFAKSIKTEASNDMDGRYNSNIIIKRQDHLNYPAIVWCRRKGLDWYLPSAQELTAIYKQIEILNKMGVNLQNKWYWASQEDGANRAYYINTCNGKIGSFHKFYHNHVRAIARF